MTVAYTNASAINVSTGATSNGVSLPSTPTSGSKLVYLLTVDKNAGTFTPPTDFLARVDVTEAGSSLLIAEKTSDGTETGTLTGSWTNSRPNKAIIVELTTTGTLSYDSSNQNYTGTAGTSLSTNAAATGADAVFAIVGWANDSAKADPADPDPTGSWTGGFTTQDEDWTATSGVGEPGFVIGSGAAAASSSVSSTFSHDGASDQMSAGIVVFAETGAGGGGSSNGPTSGPLNGPLGGFI